MISMMEWTQAINAFLTGVKSLRTTEYFWQDATLMQLAYPNFGIYFSKIMA